MNLKNFTLSLINEAKKDKYSVMSLMHKSKNTELKEVENRVMVVKDWEWGELGKNKLKHLQFQKNYWLELEAAHCLIIPAEAITRTVIENTVPGSLYKCIAVNSYRILRFLYNSCCWVPSCGETLMSVANLSLSWLLMLKISRRSSLRPSLDCLGLVINNRDPVWQVLPSFCTCITRFSTQSWLQNSCYNFTIIASFQTQE